MDPPPSSSPPSTPKSSSNPDPRPPANSSSSSSSSSSSLSSSRPPTPPSCSPPRDLEPDLEPSDKLDQDTNGACGFDSSNDSDHYLTPIPAKAPSSSPKPCKPSPRPSSRSGSPHSPTSSTSSSPHSTLDASSRRMCPHALPPATPPLPRSSSPPPPTTIAPPPPPTTTAPPPPSTSLPSLEQEKPNPTPVQVAPHPTHPPLTATPSFKSSLQVLLKRQDEELERNIEYKKEEEERQKSRSREEGMENIEKDEEEDKKEITKKESVKDSKGEKKEESVKAKETVCGEKEINKEENKGWKPSSEMPTKMEESVKKTEHRKKSESKDQEGIKEKIKEEEKNSEEKKTPKEVEGKKGEIKKEGGSSETSKERSRKKSEGTGKSGERKKSHSEEKGEKRHRGGEGEKDGDKKKEKGKDDERKEKRGDDERKEGKKDGERSEKKDRGKEGDRKERKTSKVDLNGGVKKNEHADEKRKKKEDRPSEKKEVKAKDINKNEEEGEKSVKAQGVLHIKKGDRPFAWWKRYYCVLDGKLLTYYRSQQDYQTLQGLKGSLDLAMLENIKESKRGLMRSDFPFKLGRRNLSAVSLAAETKEERSQWMDAIGELLHLTTTHSANSSPNKPSTSGQSKFATLPHTTPSKRHSSSSSEDERKLSLKEERKSVKKEGEKSKEGEDLEEKKDEEEEPQLIAPKKVPKVPIGVPVGMINLQEVKLKKVDKSKEVEKKEEEKEGKEAECKQLGKESDQTRKGSVEERTPSPEEMFGVKLKKTLTKEVGEGKDKPNNEMKEENEGKKEGKGDATPTSVKRTIKQPVIPLKPTGLLSRSEVQSPKLSPTTQKRGNMERKKSPSPTIPISRSVQALTKSVEEAKSPTKDVLPTAASEENESSSPNLKDKLKQSPPTLKYSDVVSLNESNETVTPMFDKDETVALIHESSADERDNKQTREMKTKTPQEKTNEESVSNVKAKATQPSSSPALSPSSKRSCTSSSNAPHDSPPTAESSSPANPQASKGDFDLNEFNKTCLEMEKNSDATPVFKEEDAAVPVKKIVQEASSTPPSPRGRLGTNESSGSSQLCESEGTERKSGKFKRFMMKRSHSTVGKEKESGDEKEHKDRKRRGSAFAKILHGMKHKEKGRKPSEDGTEEPAGEGAHKDHSTHPHPSPPLKQDAEPAVVKVKPTTPPSQENETPPMMKKSEEDMFKAVLESAMTLSLDDIVMRREKSQSCEGLRGSTYSYGSTSSREQEQTPSIPEKTRIREKSPIHDIPQSNRPVNIHTFLGDLDGTDSELKPVDGMISAKQIEDILSATDSTNKRRHSQGKLHGPQLIPDSGRSFAEQMGSEDSSRRPSYISLISTESDEPLPTTNFLECDRNSSSSNSLKNRESDSSGTEEQEPPPPVLLRKHSRPTESLTQGNRVSLTQPEFTVPEEDRSVSSDTEEHCIPKESADLNAAKQANSLNIDGENKIVQSGEKRREDAQDGKKSKNYEENKKHKSKSEEDREEEERGDYFCVIGGESQIDDEVLLRPGLSAAENPMRTSGIAGLREYLKEEQGEKSEEEVRSGISRLGHSVAVEKLRQTSGEL